MSNEPRQTAPYKGYLAGMPRYMKILTPLTIVMLVFGSGLVAMGHDAGIGVLLLVALVVVPRFVLTVWFGVGPQTIVGYSIWFVFEHFERKYRYFPHFVVIAIVGFFGFIIYSSGTFL